MVKKDHSKLKRLDKKIFSIYDKECLCINKKKDQKLIRKRGKARNRWSWKDMYILQKDMYTYNTWPINLY